MIGSLDLRRFLNVQHRTLVLALLATNLLVFGSLGVLALLQRGGTSSAVEVTTGSGLSLKSAQAQAWVLAQDWQEDARLVGVTTTWQVAAGDRLTLSRPVWSFTFYSPSGREAQLLSVDPGGAHALRQISLQAGLASVDADWGLDSGDLLVTFMAHGGEEFLKQHAQMNLYFRLKADGAGRSTWHLTAVDLRTRESLTVNVDALSRQVIGIE
jgi:hypothetical protein